MRKKKVCIERTNVPECLTCAFYAMEKGLPTCHRYPPKYVRKRGWEWPLLPPESLRFCGEYKKSDD